MAMPRRSNPTIPTVGKGADYFASIIDASPDCIRILDRGGHVEFMNASGLALFEVDDFERNRGQPWPSLWPEDARPAVAAALQAAVAGETCSFRAFCPTAKGTAKWWDTIVSPVFGPDDPEPIRLLATSRDITQDLETRAFLDTIVQFMPAVLFVKDAKTGRFVLVNRAAEEVFGHSSEEMLGKTDYDFFPPEQADFFHKIDLEVIASGKMQVVEEEENTTGSGETRWFHTKKVAVYDDNGPSHLLGIAEDVTASRAAREALREALTRAEAANCAKSDFLATMSHEIRTPLNGVLGMAQAMQADELSPDQRERLKVVRRSGELLLAILDDVLDLSRIEAGKLELECTDFELEHLVRGAMAAFAPLAEKKGVEAGFHVAQAARLRFNGDATRIRRLLYNLLSNAVKFTDHGRIQVGVDYNAGAVRLEVTDTGVGVAEDRLPHLFDKFVQADASHTRRFGGSGLGLSICQGLAELMGGSIAVTSRLGEGSTFIVTLPLVPAAAAPPPPLATDPAPDGALPDIKVLVAEDNEANQMVLRTLLGQAGIEPLVVANGALAVDAWEREAWDIVLMDIQMPEMDGVSATRAIRAREAETGRARTPILAVTANAMTHQTPDYLAAGMDDVVPKPLDVVRLFAALEHALDGAAAAA